MRLVLMLGAFCLLIVLILWWALAAYNRLIRMRNQVRASWAQIDVQLRRRYDLIPNLVEAVRGYAAHERATLESVTAARSRAMSIADRGADRGEVEGTLTLAIQGLLGVVEAYPDLKSNQNFAALQAELANTENKIAYARQFYNLAVQSLNTAVESVPTNLISGIAKVRPAEYFQAYGAERGPTQIGF